MWLSLNNIPENEVDLELVESYILNEVIKKRLSKSKLDLSVAALNFRFHKVEEIFHIMAPKYKGGDNHLPHFSYSQSQIN